MTIDISTRYRKSFYTPQVSQHVVLSTIVRLDIDAIDSRGGYFTIGEFIVSARIAPIVVQEISNLFIQMKQRPFYAYEILAICEHVIQQSTSTAVLITHSESWYDQ